MVIEIFLKSKNALLYTVESYLLYLWAYSSKNHSIKKIFVKPELMYITEIM